MANYLDGHNSQCWARLKLRARNYFQVLPCGWQESKQVEQPGHKLASICDPSIIGSGFLCYITTPVPLGALLESNFLVLLSYKGMTWMYRWWQNEKTEKT